MADKKPKIFRLTEQALDALATIKRITGKSEVASVCDALIEHAERLELREARRRQRREAKEQPDTKQQ